MYFVVGLAAGIGFWQLSKRYAPGGMGQINLIWFFAMLIWGASGWFFFRKLGVPILSDDLFYLPVPDWDVRLYQWTKWNFLYHRSWLFHSVLLPLGLLFASLWGMHRSSKRAWKWLRCVSRVVRVALPGDTARWGDRAFCGHVRVFAVGCTAFNGYRPLGILHLWLESVYFPPLVGTKPDIGTRCPFFGDLEAEFPIENMKRSRYGYLACSIWFAVSDSQI